MAAPVIVGEAAALSWTPVEGSGTTATLAVTQPDGTAAAAPAVSGTSTFTATFTPAQPGRHVLTWSRGTARLVDVLDAWPADPRFLISVDDAAAAVGHGQALTQAKRDELALYVAAASAVVEDITGPLARASHTHTADGGRNAVLLPHQGAITVQDVTVNGTALAAGAFVVDARAGVVYAGATGSGVFAAGRANVVVSYTAGDNVIPAGVRLAVREQVKFLRQVHTQGATRDDLGYTPSGFAVPRMVAELAEGAVASGAAAGFA